MSGTQICVKVASVRTAGEERKPLTRLSSKLIESAVWYVTIRL